MPPRVLASSGFGLLGFWPLGQNPAGAINVVEKFLEILNKTEQTTGDDKHLELLSALKLKD